MNIWYKVATDLSCEEQQATNSFSCYVCPQLYERLKPDLLHNIIDVKLAENDYFSRLFVLREDKNVKQNTVYFPLGKTCHSDMEGYIKCAENVPVLENLEITYFIRNSPDEENEVKKAIEILLTENAAIPVTEGKKITVNDFSFIISKSNHFQEGLWNRSTKTIIKFQKSQFPETFNLKSVFQLSLKLVSKQNRSHVLELLKEIQFPYDLREIPTDYADNLIKDRVVLNLASTVFVNRQERKSDFCTLKSSSGKTIMVQCFSTVQVKKHSIFAVPALLRHLRQFFEDENECFQIFPCKSPPEIGFASKAQISFISSNIFESLSSKDIDSLLATFFSKPRYCLPNSIGEISINKNVNLESTHLFWKHATSESIFFKVDQISNYSDNRVGVFICSSHTSLFQKKTLREPLPIMTSKQTFCKTEFIANVPPFLQMLQDRLLQVISDSSILISGPLGSGKDILYKSLSDVLGFSLIEMESCLIVSDSSGTTEARLRQAFSQAVENEPCVFILKNVEKLSKTREGKTDFRVMERLKLELSDLKSKHIVVIGDSLSVKDADENLVGLFDHNVYLGDLSEAERLETLLWVMEKYSLREEDDVQLEDISRKSAGFLLGDFTYLVKRASFFMFQRLQEKFVGNICGLARFGPKLSLDDFEKALEEMQQAFADSIGAPRIPSVKWEDVGGLENAKGEILDAIQMPLHHPELSRSGLKRSGILMFGPPGVGKTLLAKAVATECSLNFFSVKGPELLNMYVGQSEENVRQVFQLARSAQPCVIFFDELDSLAPNRGRSGDSGGVMDRVVSQLLAELDGLQEAGMIFVIGATNRPDLIDQALLRPGRFDRLVYLGVADEKSEQERILRSLVRKFNLDPNFSLKTLLDIIPSGLTGADLYAIASDASLKAISRKIQVIEELDDKDKTVLVSQEDFEAALSEFIPSVSQDDLAYYSRVQDTIRGNQ